MLIALISHLLLKQHQKIIMKKINDSRIYFYSAIVTLFLAVVLAVVGAVSRYGVEEQVQSLLSAEENIDKNFRKAYILLRDPHVFAGYENYDSDGLTVKNTLLYFDKKVYNSLPFSLEEKRYLDLLLERRQKGSTLSLKTAVYFIMLSIVLWAVFLYERRKT